MSLTLLHRNTATDSFEYACNKCNQRVVVASNLHKPPFCPYCEKEKHDAYYRSKITMYLNKEKE